MDELYIIKNTSFCELSAHSKRSCDRVKGLNGRSVVRYASIDMQLLGYVRMQQSWNTRRVPLFTVFLHQQKEFYVALSIHMRKRR